MEYPSAMWDEILRNWVIECNGTGNHLGANKNLWLNGNISIVNDREGEGQDWHISQSQNVCEPLKWCGQEKKEQAKSAKVYLTMMFSKEEEKGNIRE